MEEIIIIPAIFIGLPWIILHYITKWKTSSLSTRALYKSGTKPTKAVRHIYLPH